MLYTENRQENIEITEEFIDNIQKVCDFVLKEEGVKENIKFLFFLLTMKK